MLPARAEAEIVAPHDYIALVHLFMEIGRYVLEDVLGQLVQVGPQMVKPARYDVIGRNVVAELPSLA